jgi:CheY-like chemotaxis protein
MAGRDEVAFSVSDTGIGIAPEDLDSIFQDFVQLDHPIQRRVKGTGLGLPLSRKLALFLGGTVEVQSQPGVGSTFTLRIPAQWQESSPRPSGVTTEFLPDPLGRTVLAVEDSPEMIMAYKSFLRGSGFQLVAASTTREAEDLLERVKPCAIILDVVLRSEDTWGFAAKLKQTSHTRKIPLLVISTTEDRGKAWHLGVDAYLVKPVERTTLLKELRSITGDKQLSQILIVDDSEADRYVLRQHLRKLPVTITEEATGMTGIRRARDLRPDLIFLDLTMPEMTGFEVLDELKRLPDTAPIPVIIATSRHLTRVERSRLLENAAEIIDKEELSETSVTEAIYRILKDAAAPLQV